MTERTGPTERPDTESRDIISAPGRTPASDGVNVPDGVRSARRVEPLVVVGSRIRYASASLFRPDLRKRNKAALDALWRLRRTKKIYAFLNSKGASGKTAGSTTTGLLFADAIKRDCVVVDMNDSPGGTAPDGWASSARTPCSCRSICAGTAAASSRARRASPTIWSGRASPGLFVISSEAVAKTTVPKYQVKLGLEKLADGFHSVFCDLGNGIKSSGNLGAVEVADTLVFMGNVNSADSVVDFRREDPTDEGDDLKNTMEAYAGLGMPEKVKRGIIVVLGADRNMRKRYADHYGMPVDRVFIVPNNRYMKRGTWCVRDRLPLGVRVVIYEILVAMMKAERPPAHELKRATPADRENSRVASPLKTETRKRSRLCRSGRQHQRLRLPPRCETPRLHLAQVLDEDRPRGRRTSSSSTIGHPIHPALTHRGHQPPPGPSGKGVPHSRSISRARGFHRLCTKAPALRGRIPN